MVSLLIIVVSGCAVSRYLPIEWKDYALHYLTPGYYDLAIGTFSKG